MFRNKLIQGCKKFFCKVFFSTMNAFGGVQGRNVDPLYVQYYEFLLCAAQSPRPWRQDIPCLKNTPNSDQEAVAFWKTIINTMEEYRWFWENVMGFITPWELKMLAISDKMLEHLKTNYPNDYWRHNRRRSKRLDK